MSAWMECNRVDGDSLVGLEDLRWKTSLSKSARGRLLKSLRGASGHTLIMVGLLQGGDRLQEGGVAWLVAGDTILAAGETLMGGSNRLVCETASLVRLAGAAASSSLVDSEQVEPAWGVKAEKPGSMRMLKSSSPAASATEERELRGVSERPLLGCGNDTSSRRRRLAGADTMKSLAKVTSRDLFDLCVDRGARDVTLAVGDRAPPVGCDSPMSDKSARSSSGVSPKGEGTAR